MRYVFLRILLMYLASRCGCNVSVQRAMVPTPAQVSSLQLRQVRTCAIFYTRAVTWSGGRRSWRCWTASAPGSRDASPSRCMRAHPADESERCGFRRPVMQATHTVFWICCHKGRQEAMWQTLAANFVDSCCMCSRAP